MTDRQEADTTGSLAEDHGVPEDSVQDGGLHGVRAWAESALPRAELLLLPDPSGPPRSQGSDPVAETELITELGQLVGLLGQEEPLWPLLAARLGGLLAIRCKQGRGTAADQSRAAGLLRAARGGGTLTAWERQRAGLYLVMLLTPEPPTGMRDGDFTALMAGALACMPLLDPGRPEFAELTALFGELADAPLPPEARQWLGAASAVFQLGTRPLDEALSGLQSLFATLPADFAHARQLQLLLGMVPQTAGPARPSDPTPAAEAATALAAEDQDRTRDLLHSQLEMMLPRTMTADHLTALGDRAAAALDHEDAELAAEQAIVLAMARLMQALRGADNLDLLGETVNSVLRATDRLPPTSIWHQVLTGIAPALQVMAPQFSGSREDAEVAARSLADALEQLGRSPLVGPDSPLAVRLGILQAMHRGDRCVHEQDADGLRECIAEVLAVRATLDDEEGIGVTALALATLHGDLWRLTRDPELLRLEVSYYEEADRHRAGALAGGLPDVLMTATAGYLAVAENDPEILRARLERETTSGSTVFDDTHQGRIAMAGAFKLLSELSGDPDDLQRAIEAFEEVRPAPHRGGTSWQDAGLLWQLAEAYGRRNSPAAGDQAAAARAMEESLEATAGSVLLESNAEHRLQTARDGAERAVQAGWWAAAHGRADQAVAMLELGRSLVLQAAALSAALPERLSAAGHPDLAAAWQRADQADGVQPVIPSRLRRRALRALGFRTGKGPFEPPTVAELQAALNPGEADALVYLVPRDNNDGAAVIVGPDIEPCALRLPLLGGAERAPLESYLDASRERSELPADAPQEQRDAVDGRWEQALTELCDWAWPAAIGPLLLGIAEKLEANPDRQRGRPGGPRVVLVPCGNLGVVPWHAARLPEGSAARYACEIMVFSYAASGREFLRAARRRRLAPTARPVLLADPRMDLTRAEHEILSLRDGSYPNAELYGQYYELADLPVADGTPDEVLALLPGGGMDATDRPLSVLHVASHGSAGLRPTVSALLLAEPADGGDPSAGLLTVTQLLDRPAVGEDRAAGPLVVLSACETDLSRRDHDEALTLATAFIAGGAKDVVGSRWTTSDSASALMMAVFHHCLAVGGLSPADALQAAQRWMLDPHRTAPPGLNPELLREVAQPHLDRLPLWAAFVHHGHPGAATSREEEA